MSGSLVDEALRRLEQGKRVRALRDVLGALLDGRMTRAEVAAWARVLYPPESGQAEPFKSPTAACVFDSIWNIEEPDAGAISFAMSTSAHI